MLFSCFCFQVLVFRLCFHTVCSYFVFRFSFHIAFSDFVFRVCFQICVCRFRFQIWLSGYSLTAVRYRVIVVKSKSNTQKTHRKRSRRFRAFGRKPMVGFRVCPCLTTVSQKFTCSEFPPWISRCLQCVCLKAAKNKWHSAKSNMVANGLNVSTKINIVAKRTECLS